MSRDEKRAFWGFVALYTLSSLFLIFIIALLYYNKAVDENQRACQKDLTQTTLEIEVALCKAVLKKIPYQHESHRYLSAHSLHDGNGNKLFGTLETQTIDLKQTACDVNTHQKVVKKLDPPMQHVHYIVVADTNMPSNIQNIKYLIMLTVVVSLLFIAFIGYWLSKLLLKPLHAKMLQIDRFIKDSAHEINTPVTALLMSVSALKKKGLGDEKLLRHIAASSRQISDIYNTLSHVAFSDIPKNEPIIKFDLRKEVIKSIAFYKEIANVKQIVIEDNLTSLYIKMEKESASKLINNLLSNAIKYSYPKKKVTLTLKGTMLSIRDEGFGIKKEDHEEILKRYKRATTQHGGFGIGLDIVASICAQYHILLSIDSKEGYGSTFMLDFSNVLDSKV